MLSDGKSSSRKTSRPVLAWKLVLAINLKIRSIQFSDFSGSHVSTDYAHSIFRVISHIEYPWISNMNRKCKPYSRRQTSRKCHVSVESCWNAAAVESKDGKMWLATSGMGWYSPHLSVGLTHWTIIISICQKIHQNAILVMLVINQHSQLSHSNLGKLAYSLPRRKHRTHLCCFSPWASA